MWFCRKASSRSWSCRQARRESQRSWAETCCRRTWKAAMGRNRVKKTNNWWTRSKGYRHFLRCRISCGRQAQISPPIVAGMLTMLTRSTRCLSCTFDALIGRRGAIFWKRGLNFCCCFIESRLCWMIRRDNPRQIWNVCLLNFLAPSPYFLVGIICGHHRGSFPVRERLRSNVGIISGPGSFVNPYRSAFIFLAD